MEPKPKSHSDSKPGDGGWRQQRNRTRGKKDRNGTPSNRGGGTSATKSKFAGLNKDELSGIVICESQSVPTAQQFDNLFEALVVYGGSRNAKVKTSLRGMKYVTKEDLEPAEPDPSTYTATDGTIDTVKQAARMDLWKRECDRSNKGYYKYKDTMEELFETIMGQLSKEIINNLKGSTGWTIIDEMNDTIGLLSNLKELCYRDNNNKVHPIEDLIKKLLRFLQSRQNEKSPSMYVEEATNKSEVLKSAGGSIMSDAIVKYVCEKPILKDKNIDLAVYRKACANSDQSSMEIKDKVETMARQAVLAHVIVRGSNDKLHQNLRKDLEKDYAKGHDNFPVGGTETLDLLNQYKVKPNRNVRPPKDQPDGKYEGKPGAVKGQNKDNEDDKTNQEQARQLTTIGALSSHSHSPANEIEQAHQLLMNAADERKYKDDDEDDDSEFIFVQYAVNSGAQEETCKIDDIATVASDYGKYEPTIKSVADDDWSKDDWFDVDVFQDYDSMSKEWTDRNNERLTPKDTVCNVANELNTSMTSTERSLSKNSKYLNHSIKYPSKMEYVNDENANDTIDQIDVSRAFMLAQHRGGTVNPNWVLLDSQASCSVICNRKLVTNIRKHPKGNRVTIHCNAGTSCIDTVADLKGYGLVWFDEKCIANCLSLALTSDQYRVTLDTEQDQAFLVHKKNGTFRRFHRADCDLYICDLTDEDQVVLVTTVEGQKKKYSQRDFRRADRARKFQEIIMFPSNKDYKSMVNNNSINNCQITRCDIELAEDIFGPNPNIIKGKTTRRQPGPVREDHEPIPPHVRKHYLDVTLGIDIYHINGIKFL